MQDQNTRRNFLKYSTLAGLGMVVNPFSAISKDENMIGENQQIRLAKGQQIVSLLQTTDVHCQLHTHDEMFWENGKAVFRKAGGYANLGTYFNVARKRNPNTFIVDTGDMFQGSQLSVETTGKAIQPILNELGYDLYIPGNWEVVYDKENMLKLMGGLKAPKICSNMYHDLGDGKKGESIFPPYYTWSAVDIKIGFIGYTDPLVPVRQSPDYSKGIIYTHPEENLAHYVNVLREQEQCDFVILLSHLGLSQQLALANNPVCEGVDYIFGGDTHERVRKPIVCKYSKVVEPGAFGSFVGRLDLIVENGKIIKEYYALDEIDPNKYKQSQSVQNIISQHEKPFQADITKVVGYSTIPLYRYFVVENPIDTLIIDALMWKVKPDIVLSNGFRFFIAAEYLANPDPVQVAPALVKELKDYKIDDYSKLVPSEIFSWESLFSLRGLILLVGGGFLVGFGSRYAGGCTSGHAIMGLSNLQVPSLIATISFMVGGFIMANLILPYILKL